MTDCPTCLEYLERRRKVLLPHIGRWLQRQTADRPVKPPRALVDRLVRAHHERVCGS